MSLSDELIVWKKRLKSIVIHHYNNLSHDVTYGIRYQPKTGLFIDYGKAGVQIRSVFDWCQLYNEEVVHKAPVDTLVAIAELYDRLVSKPNVQTILVTRNGTMYREIVGFYRELYYGGKAIIRSYEEAKK